MGLPEKIKRRPIRNFFILPGIQRLHIIRILALVNIGTVLLMGGMVFILHQLGWGPSLGETWQGWAFRTVLPAFIIAEFTSLLVGLAASFYASRKASVPIYRTQIWLRALEAGDWTARVKFRDGDHLDAFAGELNRVAEKYRALFQELKEKAPREGAPMEGGEEERGEWREVRRSLERLRTSAGE